MIKDSIAIDTFFSWYGNRINGEPFPTMNLMRSTYRSAGPAENLRNHKRNQERFGMSRKSWRRALRLARGIMNETHLKELLKRVKLDA